MKDRRATRKPRKFYALAKQVFVGLLIASCVLMAGLLLYAFINPNTAAPVYLALININVVLAILGGLYVGRSLMLLFLDRRGRLKGARLHVRLLGIFSILAVLPALFVGIFSFYLLNKGLDSWFSTQVSSALEGSLQVAEAYIEEHEKRLLAEIQNIARDPILHDGTFLLDPPTMRKFLQKEQSKNTLDSLTLYDNTGAVLAAAGVGDGSILSSEILLFMQDDQVKQAQIFRNLSGRRLLASTSVGKGLWLVGERWMHPFVLARVDETEDAWRAYDDLQKNRKQFSLLFNLMAILIGGGCIAGAVWTGIRLADKIIKPVTSLVHATNRVSAGDLDIRLQPRDDDEIGILTQSFNRMTLQLKSGRDLLEKKNNELDDRRRTMEAVLTGVLAGVVSVDGQGIVKIANKTAKEMLGIVVGRSLGKVNAQLAEVLATFLKNPTPLWQAQMRLTLPSHETRTFLVRLVPQWETGGNIHTIVLTFDDITPLISAQKTAAWGDVAQRLAHEIKNPLTPIQLSAERLKRRYMKEIDTKEDKELFKQLTETIVRQTEDMRTMLNEFSDFARMPTPKMQSENMLSLSDEALVLQKESRPDITFSHDYQLPPEEAELMCDRSHVMRVLTNVLENAINAIHEQEKGNNTPKGEIKIVVKRSQGDTLVLSVLDNGKGLPKNKEVETLFDPYITTRTKGTGLGLAIVKRVMDDHGGYVQLKRRKQGGTEVELTFPLKGNEHLPT